MTSEGLKITPSNQKKYLEEKENGRYELKQKKDVIPFNYSYFTTCQEIFQNLK